MKPLLFWFVILAGAIAAFAVANRPTPVEKEARVLYSKAFDLEHSGTAEGRAEAHRIYLVLQTPQYKETSVSANAAKRQADLLPRFREDLAASSAKELEEARRANELNTAIKTR